MQRYRRLVLLDRVIPFLAALVGLIALAGAMLVQVNADAARRESQAAVTALQQSIAAMPTSVAAAAPAADTATTGDVAALRDRIAALETQVADQQAALAAAPVGVPLAAPQEAVAEIDPNLPTTDCIPLGKRFMVIPNETFPLCQSATVVRTGAITDDTVTIEGAGPVVETGFGTIAGSGCTVSVFSADSAGFGEVRVTCS